MTDRTQLRDEIALAALPHVVFDGWTEAVLKAAAKDCGHREGMAAVAFMGGPLEAAEHLADLADRKMAEELAGRDLSGMSVRERLALAIKVRLTQWADEKEAMRRTLQMFALPLHAPRAVRITARTVDAIWTAIGDRSADFNWYTKRFYRFFKKSLKMELPKTPNQCYKS